MKKIMFVGSLLLIFCTAFIAGNQTNTAEHQQQLLENLKGTYKDPTAVDWGRGSFGTREFTFSKGKWTLKFTLALDPGMKNQVFVFRTFGTYKVLDQSATIANTFNALFVEDKKFVTLKTGDIKLAQAFGLTQCGLQKDIEKDISVTGCSLWKPVAECNEDHDLLSIDKDGKLYFGIRPPDNNMCSAAQRPTQLNVPVVKQ